jgi:hypothetical protein
MKAIKKFAIALLASMSLSTPLVAGSADFAGIYGGFTASMIGASIDGSHTSSSGNIISSNISTNRGTVGAVVPIAGIEAGFNLPLGDIFFLGVGGSLHTGTAKLAESDDSAHEAEITIEARDAETYYIQPSISLFDNSAMYVKFGTRSIDIEAVGDVQTSQKSALNGDFYGAGMLTQFNSGIYVRAEASATSYDDFSVTGVGASTTSVMQGEPTIASGTVAIGFKF